MTERWRVLLIGDAARSEFRDARAWLASRTDFHYADSCAAAVASLASPSVPPPDAVIVCQTRPGQYSAAQVEEVYRLAPLARMVALLGSFCEGEPRSGKPWPGVNRVYWYDWRPRFEQEFGSEGPGRWAHWELPRTATDVDTVLHTAVSNPRHPSIASQTSQETSPIVAIRAQNASTLEGLADACHSFGYRHVSVSDGNATTWPSADLLLWDGDSLDEPDGSKLAAACRQIAPKPVLAMLGFPRSQDHQRAAAAGVSAVLAKPFQLEDLCWYLHALIPEKTLLRKLA